MQGRIPHQTDREEARGGTPFSLHFRCHSVTLSLCHSVNYSVGLFCHPSRTHIRTYTQVTASYAPISRYVLYSLSLSPSYITYPVPCPLPCPSTTHTGLLGISILFPPPSSSHYIHPCPYAHQSPNPPNPPPPVTPASRDRHRCPLIDPRLPTSPPPHSFHPHQASLQSFLPNQLEQ